MPTRIRGWFPGHRALATMSAGVAVVTAAAGSAAHAGPHTEFTLVANEASGDYTSPLDVAINDTGGVLTQWLLTSGSHELKLVGGPNARTVAFGGVQGSTPYFNVAFPAVNNLGQVSFVGIPYVPLALHVFRDTAGTTTPLRMYGEEDSPGNATSINDAGLVVTSQTVGGVSSVWRSDDTTIAQVGTDGIEQLGDASINAGGDVAFYGRRNGHFGIYRGGGGAGPLTTIADTSGPLAGVFNAEPALNDLGQVAFSAELDAGGEAIYIGDGTTLTPIADSTGAFGDLSWTSINNAGHVAFTATLDAGGVGGVFFYDGNGTIEEVVKIGDPLFGSTVTSVFTRPNSLNEAGDIAFLYRLSNGDSGIAVASVPEPAALAGLLAPAAALLGRRRRSNT